jgi:tRNA A37 N6-isopentenylltransferase MiaA
MASEAVKRELESLYEQHGALTVDIVLAAAKRKTNVLHDQFEWVDSKAAAKYRSGQAARLIRGVEYLFRTERTVCEAPCYVRDPRLPKGQSQYKRVAEIATERDVAAMALARELRKVANATERCEKLAEALGLSQEIITWREEIDLFVQRIEQHPIQ